MDDDGRTRARTFFQTVLDELWVFASQEFQEAVWVRGDHPSGFVQDYVKAMEVFRDFVSWRLALADDCWKLVPLTDVQVDRLKGFYRLFERFDENTTVRDGRDVLADHHWPAIVAEARKTLVVLRDGPHGYGAEPRGFRPFRTPYADPWAVMENVPSRHGERPRCD